MNRLMAIAAVTTYLFLMSGVAAVAQPTIDGVIGAGEWDAYYLGTSVTAWSGGMSVDVYGFADASNLYAAYVADTSQPGWSSACGLNINGNFYFKTPQTAVWPGQGYTLLEMAYPRVMQTDGSDWVDLGDPSGIPGIQSAYIDMFDVDDGQCAAGTTGNNVAEFMIPLSLLTYAGDDGQISLSGQYWQYDWATSFIVQIPAPGPAMIPTLTEWGMIIFSLLISGTVLWVMRKRQKNCS